MKYIFSYLKNQLLRETHNEELLKPLISNGEVLKHSLMEALAIRILVFEALFNQI